MSERSHTHRRLTLALSITALLLAVAAPPVAADGGHSGSRYRSHSSHRHTGFHISVGHRSHFGFHRGYGYRYYAPYRHYVYYPYRHYYPYHRYGYGYYGERYHASSYGRLDLNVKPKKTTQVFIDGKYVGVAGNFDGWPDHLWLERDTYELILYNPGYETIVRHVEVQPGVTIDIRETMQPGESSPPEELSTASAKTQKAPTQRYGKPPQRERAPAHEPGERAAPAEPRRPDPAAPGVLDARGEPARLRLTIAPGDASVYLDGHFLGVASELNERQGGILVDPGEHVLEVVRPGYSSREIQFDAGSGKKLELDIGLESTSSKAGFSA